MGAQLGVSYIEPFGLPGDTRYRFFSQFHVMMFGPIFDKCTILCLPHSRAGDTRQIFSLNVVLYPTRLHMLMFCGSLDCVLLLWGYCIYIYLVCHIFFICTH